MSESPSSITEACSKWPVNCVFYNPFGMGQSWWHRKVTNVRLMKDATWYECIKFNSKAFISLHLPLSFISVPHFFTLCNSSLSRNEWQNHHIQFNSISNEILLGRRRFEPQICLTQIESSSVQHIKQSTVCCCCCCCCRHVASLLNRMCEYWAQKPNAFFLICLPFQSP